MRAPAAASASPGGDRTSPAVDDGGSALVAILAPAGRDGAVAAAVLARAGLPARVCGDMAALCAAVGEEAGALLVAEEALDGAARDALLAALAAQPAWSDVPVVVLTGEGELSRTLSPALEAVTARANATLLERPVRVATLVTALRSALRARRRQFDLRDHLAERSAAEAALRAAQAEAEAANRTKGQFLANMSHELRTPLNAIGGYAELIELGLRGPVTEAQQADLARLRRAGRHLESLINDVLNYAKLEAGRVQYDLQDVLLDDVVADVEAMVGPQLRARGLAFAHDGCAPDTPERPHRVRADAEKVRQILVNLLTNAIKFTDPGGRVALACDGASHGAGGAPAVVRVRVTDTGRGIPPEHLARVFEPFVQVDRDLTHASQQGVGLGLAISRDLARGMGGDLTAESAPGAGSTFTLTLPAA